MAVEQWMTNAAEEIKKRGWFHFGVLLSSARIAAIIASHSPEAAAQPMPGCSHERLDEEGYCRRCGSDMRSGKDLSPSLNEATPVVRGDRIPRDAPRIRRDAL